MSPSAQREEEIFADAMQLPTEQRSAYLNRACGDDQALRQRIEALLRALERASPLLREPSATLFARNYPTIPPTEKPGDWIGRYKLLEKIGEGGCGAVYVAEQEEPVRRRVALKVIKLGMDTKQVMARFDAERQALAMMDHPNIAKVLDAGATEAGRPFFVMELVRGIKITDYCDHNDLSPRERLDLFVQVCRAIQHAHQKGIIHRDIKPSNILVTSNDGLSIPKVIDFGIAKATQGRLTDHTVYTAFEQFIGTPAYMSPEQAAMTMLDIDTRTDVYSLGVLLYELLTGNTPFDGKELLAAGLDEMRRTIREVEPVKPSARLTQERTCSHDSAKSETQNPKSEIDQDLDWIVMKCLEKDRTRRYETANGLATDISRHLNNEPVIARPPSHLYRFQKAVRRNKLAFGAATAVALALIIGLVVSTAMYLKAETEKRNAQAEKKKAQAEAAKSRQTAEFLKEVLITASPHVSRGRDTTLLREILGTTAQRIGSGLPDQPEVEIDLRRTAGWTYEILQQHAQAEIMFRQALAVVRKHFANNNSEVALTLNQLGFALLQQDKLSEAEAVFREALEVHRKLGGNVHSELAFSLNGLAGVLKSQGKLTEAEAMFREALAIRRKVFGNDNHFVSNTLGNLAETLGLQGKLAEAEENYREAVGIARKHPEADHDTPYKLEGLAKLLQQKGEVAEAEALLRESLTMKRSLFGDEHPSVAETRDSLVAFLKKQHKEAEANALLEVRSDAATKPQPK